MSLSPEEITEKVSEGSIHALVTFEVAGKPAEHVEQSLSTYMEKLHAEKALEIISIHKEEAAELEGDDAGFFAAFSEVEMVAKTIETLVSVIFAYSPATIEILAPEDLKLSQLKLQNWLNDVVSRIHNINQHVLSERQRNKALNTAVHRVVWNFILVLCKTKARTLEEIAERTGVKKEIVEAVIESMEKQDAITREGEKWTLNS